MYCTGLSLLARHSRQACWSMSGSKSDAVVVDVEVLGPLASAASGLPLFRQKQPEPLRRACRFRQRRVAETSRGARRSAAAPDSAFPGVEQATLAPPIGCAPRRHATAR